MMLVFDFETQPIEDHSAPIPCGLALLYVDTGESVYITDWDDMRVRLSEYWDKKKLLAHNLKFDMGVAIQHLGMPVPRFPTLFHDSMIAASLDPDTDRLGLKDLCPKAKLAQAEMNHWMDGNLKPIGKERTIKYGRRICDVPPEVAAPYALQDVESCHDVFTRFKEYVSTAAYKRAQRALLAVYHMEQRGVPIRGFDDLYETAAAETEALAFATGIPSEILQSPAKLLNTLLAMDGAIDTSKLARTPTGRMSTKSESLSAAISDPLLWGKIEQWKHSYKQLTAFIEPWHERLKGGDDSLHAQYRIAGATITGRMSSSKPNMQQVPPALREFLVPRGTDNEWVSCDYSQQELRILAHFCGGNIAQAFHENPDVDLHQWVADEMECTRKAAKAIQFALIYGAGNQKIADQLGCNYDEAYALRAAYYKKFPEVKKWLDSVIALGDAGKSVETIGGRKLKAETRRVVLEERDNPFFKGGVQSAEAHEERLSYKLPNKLIQGSGADMALEALAQAYENKLDLMTVVHDEINITLHHHGDAYLLEQIMIGAIPLSVPVRVDTHMADNWKDCK